MHVILNSQKHIEIIIFRLKKLKLKLFESNDFDIMNFKIKIGSEIFLKQFSKQHCVKSVQIRSPYSV